MTPRMKKKTAQRRFRVRPVGLKPRALGRFMRLLFTAADRPRGRPGYVRSDIVL
jgi:hypothetical protein